MKAYARSWSKHHGYDVCCKQVTLEAESENEGHALAVIRRAILDGVPVDAFGTFAVDALVRKLKEGDGE
jgi:hypothetical protein